MNTGSHFDIQNLWGKVKGHSKAQNIKTILSRLGSNEDVQWDIEEARAELLFRNFPDSEIDDTMPRNILDFIEVLD